MLKKLKVPKEMIKNHVLVGRVGFTRDDILPLIMCIIVVGLMFYSLIWVFIDATDTECVRQNATWNNVTKMWDGCNSKLSIRNKIWRIYYKLLGDENFEDIRWRDLFK